MSPGIKTCCELITLTGCTDLPRSEGQKARSQNSNMTWQEKEKSRTDDEKVSLKNVK